MNVEELLKALNNEGRKWTLFRHSKPSKKKMIAALIAWSQNLSQQLLEQNDRERELQQTNGDLRSEHAQLQERLETLTTQITYHKAKETQGERKLSKFENKAKDLEEALNSTKTKTLELELTKQQLEKEIESLIAQVKGKDETINHVEDSLEKCRHDCTNKETQYLTISKEKSRLEDKLHAATDEKNNLGSEIERLHGLLESTDRKQRKLQKDLSATRHVLNDSCKDKSDLEKRLGAELENLKYQVFLLSKSAHEKTLLVDTLRKEKVMIMMYYQDKIDTIRKGVTNQEEADKIPPAICTSEPDQCVQTSILEANTNILKNQILDLEFRLYRYEKLTAALVDNIQSHDPNYVLEDDDVLQAYLEQNQALFCDRQPVCSNDLFLEPDYGNNLDLCTAVSSVCLDDLSSVSTDTCATADSPKSEKISSETFDIDTYETSTCSESDTSSLYSDFPTNGS